MVVVRQEQRMTDLEFYVIRPQFDHKYRLAAKTMSRFIFSWPATILSSNSPSPIDLAAAAPAQHK
jgi:hypothetical protein